MARNVRPFAEYVNRRLQEEALRKAAADSTNLQVTPRTDAGHGKERASL